MKILAIETSCDETGVSILEIKKTKQGQVFKVLANALSSQVKIHAPYGGVYPMLAKREHIKNLPILLEKVLKGSGIFREESIARAGEPSIAIRQQANMRAESAENPGLDLIAVTSGPGLEPALWTGIVFAEKLARKWNVPVIPVNHMEGHIFSVFAKARGQFKIPTIKFPALSLLVSGGHTELVLIKDWHKYKIVGETLDDAVGEAFDKVARILGLPYPGGPEISKLAEKLRNSPQGRALGTKKGPTFSRISLPRPMLKTENLNFSYSGLKTAVLYLVKKIPKLDEKIKAEIAFEFERAAIECLTYKTKKAIEKYKPKTLILAGGVAANKHLRQEIKKLTAESSKLKAIQVLMPIKELTTDNSIMIGVAGYFNFKKGGSKKKSKIKAKGGLRL